MGQFFKQICASLIGTLVGLTLFMVLGASGLVLLLIAATMQESGPAVKDKSFLVFDLSIQIKDTKPPSTLSQVLQDDGQTTMTLRSVLAALEKATKDQRIVGILLDGRGSQSENGYATLAEIRSALEKFRAAGKKIIVYDVELSEKDYYLASVADEIFLNPMGLMEFNGIATQPIFWAGALQKYGIGVQVVRVGSYKGAVEPFTRENLSPQNQQQTQALLDDLWGTFLTAVSKSRDLSPQQLQAIADNQGILTPTEAQQAQLIDGVAYFDQVVAKISQLSRANSGDQTFPKISLESYTEVQLSKTPVSASGHKIAVIYAEGEIVDGEGTVNTIGSERFAKELRKIRQDDSIKAVVLRVNSPGGSATAAEIIGREVQLISQEKPLIVSMGNVAASGGYWISMGAKHIFAEPNTITGSIGVFGLLLNVKDIANNNGITWDVVKTAKLADLSTSTRPKTPEELAIFQRYVQQTYGLFIDKVSRSRNLSKNQVNEIAQGRVWSGEDGKKIGLVDEIGGLEAAINWAAKEAKLGNNWQLEEYPEQKTFESILIEKLANTQVKHLDQSVAPVTLEVMKMRKELETLQIFNDPKGVYSYLHFEGNIK